jgi:hypothetical protein
VRSLRLLALVCLSIVPILGTRALSQSAGFQRPLPRITEEIDDDRLASLSGNTLPVANSKTDLGRARPDLAMTDLVLVLSRSPEQQAAFDTFVASQYDPASPSFHHWLQPAEVGENFGPSTDDIATISAWLTGHGLTVAEPSKDRMSIRFSGTAAQVEKAFHTEIHNIQVNGEKHIANIRDPQIPGALAPVVSGIKALNDFRPHPLHTIGQKAKLDPSTGKWSRVPNASATLSNTAKPTAVAPHPDYGITVSTSGGSYPIEDVTPYDFATIYNVLPLWNAGTDGTGQTIAIAGTSDINPQDVANYRSVFGLPAGPALNTIVANGVDPGQCTSYSGYCTLGDLFENTLDVEVSGAVAKNAQIDLVVSGQTSPTTDTVYSSANYVIQNNTAKILSVSYGLCELFMGTGGNAAYNNLWETGAAEGIGIFVATGDAGSPTCDQSLATSLPYGARFGLSVNGLASSAYVTAVGGTDFAWCKPTINSSGQSIGCSSTSPYWNPANTTTNGASAAGYIPEIPWNDSCASSLGAAYLESLAKYMGYTGITDPETACNFVVQKNSTIYQRYGIDLSFFVNSIGGGGGASTCTTNSTDDTTTTPDPASCSGGYAKPTWQSGVSGIPSDGKRDLPDLSFFAGNGLWNSATLVCVSATGTCVSTTGTFTEPVSQEVGGTSVAAPQMAGVMALINQKAGVNQGSPNPELYALAAKQSWAGCTAESVKTSSSCYFNDVDTSTIATPCELGAPNCSITHTGDTWGILSGFNAGNAYDQATGLGSLNVANVVNGWTSLFGTAPATITLTPAQNTIVLDQPLQVVMTVAGSSGTPIGNVTIVGGGYDGGAQSLASGSYTFTIPAFSLSAGSYNLTGSYQGDSTYAQSSGTAPITVNKITPTVSVTLNPSSIGANTPITVNITVAGSATDPKPSGTMQLTAGTWVSYCTLAAGTCSITIPVNTLPNGTDSVTVSYPGDADFTAATGSATENVSALTPAITALASPSSFYADDPFTVTVNITGSGSLPTGQVTLGFLNIDHTAYSIQGQLANGKYVFNVPGNRVFAGQDRVELSYAGDSTYLPGGVDVPIKVTAAPTTTTVTPSSANIYTNAALTLNGTVTASSGSPSGYIFASIGNYTSPPGDVLNNQYSITIPPGTLPAGSDAIAISYQGDSYYAPSATSTTVTVTQWTKIDPTISITPAATTVGAGLQLGVAVAISGSGGPGTGSVTLSSGSWSVGPWAVINGTANFTIPSNTLPIGTDTLTALYNGDPTYLGGTATTSVTVNPSTFTLSPQNNLTLTRGNSTSEIIQIRTTDGYNGIITFTCALTTSPAGAAHLPACLGATLPFDGSYGSSGGSVYLVVTTTAQTAFLSRPSFPGRIGLGGTALAILILVGIPARRRGLHAFLGVFILLFIFAGLNACGGGGGGSTGSTGGTGGGTNVSGTTPGVYTFTVTGTGNPAVTPAPTTTFNLTVN